MGFFLGGTMITNLILSSMLTFSGFNNPIVETHQDNVFQQNTKINFRQSICLIYIDIFELTKKYRGQTFSTEINTKNVINPMNNSIYSETNYQFHIGEENNQIAEMFWKQNLWEIGYLSAVGLSFMTINILDAIDTSGISAYLFTVGLNTAEMICCSHWISNFRLDMNIYTTVFTYQF
jgi:hypothetical protein